MISVQNLLLPLNGNRIKYLLLLALLFGQLHLFGQETRRIEGQRYLVHVVEKGHTLFAISKKYSTTIDVLLEHNPGARDGLSIGEEILIPEKGVDRKAARDNPPEISGQYLEHVVERRETLFAISRKYNIDVNSILEHNPEANEGLKPGQVLRIFTGDIPVDDPVAIQPAQHDSLMTHHVKPGETFYSIARTYEVSIDSLKLLNNLRDTLPQGVVLRIPKYTDEYLAQRDTMKIVQPLLTGSRNTYNVGLMLPFSTAIQDSLLKDYNPTQPLQLYTLTRIAAEMYRGVQLAVDSLVQSGLQVELFVHDVSDDLIVLDDLLKDPIMKKLHLIIGPLHRESFEMVSKWAAPLGITVVAPVPNQRLQTRYSGSYIVHSNAMQQVRFLSRYVAKMHFTDNVVVVDSDKFKDHDFVQAFIDSYQSPMGDGITLPVVKLDKFGIDPVKNKLQENRRNIVVVPSTDLGFVSDFMNRLSNVKSSEYDIQVIGMEKWQDYHNIDMVYKNRFKLTVPSSTFLNFEQESTQSFIDLYRKQYEQEPGSDGYAFLGFDVAWYFLSNLLKHGLDFPQHLNALEHNGIHLGFRFDPQPNATINRHIYLLQYDNYELKRIN